MQNKLIIKRAQESDTHIILEFIKKLAEYEKLSNEVTATTEQLRVTLFAEDSNTHCLIGYYNERPVCFALYFFNYSTFLGKRGMYLEDLFVLTEMRGKGFGKQMLIVLAQIASENDCGRFEWSVLDWNKPAIDFYDSLGAKPNSGWTVYRLDEKAIKKLLTENKEIIKDGL